MVLGFAENRGRVTGEVRRKIEIPQMYVAMYGQMHASGQEMKPKIGPF